MVRGILRSWSVWHVTCSPRPPALSQRHVDLHVLAYPDVVIYWFIKNVAVHLWSYLSKILMDLIIFISGNGNECRLQVRYLLTYFPCDVNMTSLSRLWYSWAATAFAVCVVRLRAVADWWLSWPMANKLASLCLCQCWTFWTYIVTVSLFSLYLMNFMFHTTLDAVSNILTVH